MDRYQLNEKAGGVSRMEEIEVSKSERQIDTWSVKMGEGSDCLPNIFKVEHVGKLVDTVEHASVGQRISHFQLRTILEILKKGGYTLEEKSPE